jgi:hypothetical protein
MQGIYTYVLETMFLRHVLLQGIYTYILESVSRACIAAGYLHLRTWNSGF